MYIMMNVEITRQVKSNDTDKKYKIDFIFRDQEHSV